MYTECPPTEDGFERFACPTPDKEGRFRCIDDHVLCDGYIDCPNGDDEDRKNCFFFKTVSTKKRRKTPLHVGFIVLCCFIH